MLKPTIWLSTGMILALLGGYAMAEEGVKKDPSPSISATDTFKPAAKMHKKHHAVVPKKIEEKKPS